MPTISHFYRIIIVMYLRNKEHNPPHIHAITQDFDAPFLISTGEIMEGDFPPKAKHWSKSSFSNTRRNCFRCGKPNNTSNCRRSTDRFSRNPEVTVCFIKQLI